MLDNSDVHVGKSKVYVLITGRAKLSQTKLLEIRPPRCWKILRHSLNIEFMGQAIVHSISAFCDRFAWAVVETSQSDEYSNSHLGAQRN